MLPLQIGREGMKRKALWNGRLGVWFVSVLRRSYLLELHKYEQHNIPLEVCAMWGDYGEATLLYFFFVKS